MRGHSAVSQLYRMNYSGMSYVSAATMYPNDTSGYVKLRYPSWYAGDSPTDVRNPIALGQLYTQPDATGQGTGSALMDWAIAEARARGHDAIQLSVWAENFGGHRFYERYGFAKVAEFDFWVGDHRDDEFLYELRLD